MEYSSIKDALTKQSGKIKIRGWCYRERGSKAVRFIVMRDSSEIIQCVFDKEKLSPEIWEESQKIKMEASFEVSGELAKNEKAPTGYEVQVEELKIIGLSDTYPIAKDFSPEFLLDQRHLWLRSRKMTAMLKIRSCVSGAIHKFFRDRGYYEFDAPILQPTQAEGGSTVFEVKYYKDKTYLSQTWQLYAESAIFSLEKIYNFGPTFRAEKSKTSRHLSEFWMAEMEAAWMELPELVQTSKEEIKFIISEVLDKCKPELALLKQDTAKFEVMLKKDWPTITYEEALKILKEKEKMDVPWGKDLRTIEEEKLMLHFDTPVVVTHYPKEAMAFYKPEDPKKPGTALCFDMLAPEGYGEIIGGSQRDTDTKKLIEFLKRDGEDPEDYKFYLDLRKYGSVPHSGYGVGVERVVRWICGFDSIKDAIPFPRTMLRFKP
jgi:asparaginyl-tRNA synthetase